MFDTTVNKTRPTSPTNKTETKNKENKKQKTTSILFFAQKNTNVLIKERLWTI
eukprot:m.44224 g.44224  ORF g.44224 m.44224 type:complete len:53 (-) comp19623_c0_seq1:137-295(-)